MGFRAEGSGRGFQPLIVLIHQRPNEPLACLQVGFEVLLVDVNDL